MPQNDFSRSEQAIAAARELIEALEGDLPITACLMKGQKLARLMRDSHAQRWLTLETMGYPEDLRLADLGPCAQYAWRHMKDSGKTLAASLPQMEAEMKASEAVLAKIPQTSLSSPAENWLVANATDTMLGHVAKQQDAARAKFVNACATFNRHKSQVHRYASETLISLELGSVAENLFDSARRRADEFIRRTAPKAAEQLLAAQERMADGTNESRSAALTSCRRLLVTVADAVFPSRDTPHTDGGGRKRKVGQEEYINRLYAHIEGAEASGSTRAILRAQVQHLGARLDALHDKTCKGVHDDVTEEEARLVLIETYLFVSQLALLSAAPANA